MDPNWAADHLQVIRTLMERTATYRRALAPIMLLLGCLAFAAAAAGWFLHINSVRGFILFWLAIGLAGIAISYCLARRQAVQASEPFWSPPTRRVTQALIPPLLVGMAAGLYLVYPRERDILLVWWIPILWMALYGCALHAAGFFMQRGIKLLGGLFLASAAVLSIRLALAGGVHQLRWAHFVMGAVFGGWHFAYGIYLFFSESRKPSA